MALTKGKIKIGNTEYDVKSCKVSIAGLEADDSGMTDDGVYHYNYVYNRKRTITITHPTTTQEVVAAVLNAVAGKTYNLTYYDAIDGEKTIQAHTKSTNSTLFSGVLLNGLWSGVSFKAEEIGGEMA